MCGQHPGCQRPACDGRDLLQGMLKPGLLLLIAGEKASHGYELGAELARLGLECGVDSGRIYRSLRQLEAEGLVASQWQPQEAGPARRNYLVTPQGLEFLRLWQFTLEAALERMERFRHSLRELWEEDDHARDG